MSAGEQITHDFGVIDEVGEADAYTRTELKLADCAGIRSLLISMTWGVGVDRDWRTFTWRVDGENLAAVVADLRRVIMLAETGQGDRISGRWISRFMAYDQGARLLRDLGPVAFHNGRESAHGFGGENNGRRCFFYETVAGTTSCTKPFPISSLRAILAVTTRLQS